MALTWRTEDDEERLQIDAHISHSMYSVVVNLKTWLQDLLSSPYGEEEEYPVKILFRDPINVPPASHSSNIVGIQLISIEPVNIADQSDSVLFVASLEIHGIFYSAKGGYNAFDKGLLLMEQLKCYFIDSTCEIRQNLLDMGITLFGHPSLDLRPEPPTEEQGNVVDIVLNLDLSYNVIATNKGSIIKSIVKNLYNNENLYEEFVIGDPLPEPEGDGE
jgi:hypothetical protein